MGLRQQSALEFIVTYSWALLIISLFVVSVLLISDTRAPAAYLQSTCSIQPLFPCSESLLAYNTLNPLQYYIVFTNQLGSVIYFPVNAINITTTNVGKIGTSYSYGNCTPAFASQGATVLCRANIGGNLKPNVGSQAIVNFGINYNICKTNNLLSCAPGLYKSSGYSVQNVAPVGIKLNNITFASNVPGGTVILGGITYFSDTSEFLPSGNYVVYAQPPSGDYFVSWAITNSLTTTIASTTLQNTTLVVSSNAFVTAKFG